MNTTHHIDDIITKASESLGTLALLPLANAAGEMLYEQQISPSYKLLALSAGYMAARSKKWTDKASAAIALPIVFSPELANYIADDLHKSDIHSFLLKSTICYVAMKYSQWKRHGYPLSFEKTETVIFSNQLAAPTQKSQKTLETSEDAGTEIRIPRRQATLEFRANYLLEDAASTCHNFVGDVAEREGVDWFEGKDSDEQRVHIFLRGGYRKLCQKIKPELEQYCETNTPLEGRVLVYKNRKTELDE